MGGGGRDEGGSEAGRIGHPDSSHELECLGVIHKRFHGLLSYT